LTIPKVRDLPRVKDSRGISAKGVVMAARKPHHVEIYQWRWNLGDHFREIAAEKKVRFVNAPVKTIARRPESSTRNKRLSGSMAAKFLS